MSRMIDLTGKRFSRLTVLRHDGKDPWGQFIWVCRCDCGKEHRAVGGKLRRGEIKSCGCLLEESRRESNTTHGHFRFGAKPTREYETWARIIDRCENKNCSNYSDYGGRGITMCERWRHDFAAFLADMGPRPSVKHSIDRINNDGNYEPSNCRWADKFEQMQNRRNVINITFEGETACVREWSRRLGVKYLWLYHRVRSGVPFEQIVADLRAAA